MPGGLIAQASPEAATGALEDQPMWNLMRAKRRGTPNIIGLLMRAGTVGSTRRSGTWVLTSIC